MHGILLGGAAGMSRFIVVSNKLLLFTVKTRRCHFTVQRRLMHPRLKRQGGNGNAWIALLATSPSICNWLSTSQLLRL